MIPAPMQDKSGSGCTAATGGSELNPCLDDARLSWILQVEPRNPVCSNETLEYATQDWWSTLTPIISARRRDH